MSRHQHHPHKKHHSQQESARPNPYRPSKWLVIGVILMLIAMAAYVLTLDESVVPAEDVPAADVVTP